MSSGYEITFSITAVCTCCGKDLPSNSYMTVSKPSEGPLDRDNPYERKDRRVFIAPCPDCFGPKQDQVVAQRDELLAALRVARGIVITERDAAYEGVVNPSTGVIEDPDDDDWVAGYDRALQQIDAAIAKAAGGAA